MNIEALKSDSELVSLAQSGQRSALQELFERHYTKIFGTCRRMLRNEEDACDATQEVFLTIVRSLKNFTGQAAFSTWAYRIAVNACKDELVKRQKRPALSPRDDDFDPESLSSSAGDVAEVVVDVQTALVQLAEEYRIAVVLRDQAELSYDEIAEMLDLPAGTVKSRIARGRAELARLLKLDEATSDAGAVKQKTKSEPASNNKEK